ncbi:MAG: phosphotransferase family protein [Pseudomonadota bacterium]
MGDATPDELKDGLTRACARVGLPSPQGLHRLTGGATMESWRFDSDGEPYVLRRAPSLEFMKDRPFGHDVEVAVIRAARSAGVTAPEVIVELEPADGIGSGFVMGALPGTPDPRQILEMDDPDSLLKQAARDLARIHSLKREGLPDAVPVMDYRQAIADLKLQFEESGGDRPIISLGLKWMEDNCPDPVEPVLNHGDYRMGNLLAENSRLTGVLDWELAHFSDRHEDLAFGCMAVWRFHRYDRPALGLGSLEDYFAAYEAEAGVRIDRERFRYWLIHRTVWWALGCLKMAAQWRSGADRMLERVVISRRTSEQELDLLMLLEEDAPQEERKLMVSSWTVGDEQESGEASDQETLTAVSEWIASVKDKLPPHDRFQAAVARNALGIARREVMHGASDLFFHERRPSQILKGDIWLDEPEYLATLKMRALAKVEIDSPKYPALAVARQKWTGED